MGAFDTKLAPDLTTIALCWRIVRADGIALGFTAHDRSLTIGGLRFESAPGINPSAIEIGGGLDVDTLEVAGALSADAITAIDLAAGRYDRAAVSLFMVDWTDPAGPTLPLARGTLGEIERRLSASGGEFAATLRGPTAALEAVAVESCAPECRAELGDRRCRIDLAPRTVRTTGGPDPGGAIAIDLAGPLERFVHGRLRVLDGVHAGCDLRIAAVDGATLMPLEPLPSPLSPGTAVELREGCDKRLVSCVSRFGNVANLRGEPHVPGGDVLTRFFVG